MTGGAYEELERDGKLGPISLKLLQITARMVTNASAFPPSGQHVYWTEDAIYDLLADMIARPGAGQRWVMMCYAIAYDDRSLQAAFYTSISNFLKDEAKKTPRGKLRRRIARRLAADDRYRSANVSGSPWWALATHAADAYWQGDIGDLIAAAWQVDGVAAAIHLNRSGPTPARTVHALMSVIAGVLEYTGGAVREEDLAKALEARFGLDASPQTASLYTIDAPQAGPADDDGSDDIWHEEAALAVASASQIWVQFTDSERLVLPYLEEPAKVAKLLDVGPKQAQAVTDALREKLKAALVAAPDPQELLRELLRFGEGLAQDS
jgi:hypothetical protein